MKTITKMCDHPKKRWSEQYGFKRIGVKVTWQYCLDCRKQINTKVS